MIYYPSARVVLRVNFESSPETYHLLEVLPQYAKVDLNSYQQADEFEVRLDYSVFPIDPRTVKSCGIGIWMGTTEKLGELVDNSPDKCLLTGFADDFEINLEQENQMLTVKGRDFTGVLLDNKWFHGNVPLDLTLDDGIKWVLNHDPAFGNIKVINNSKTSLPKLSKIKLRDYEEHTPSKEDSYWDIIYDLCIQCGFICYIKLDELIIDRAKNLSSATKITDFIYGGNLATLIFKKNYARQTGLNVEVRCYDPSTKKTLVARYPDPPIEKDQMLVPSKNISLKAQKVNIEPPRKSSKPKQVESESDNSKTYEYTSFVVSNVKDMSTLKNVAEDIWNQLYRRQIEGSMETFELKGLDETQDFTTLRNGDAVSLTIGEKFKEIINTMPYAQQVDFLINHGFNSRVASEIARNINKLDTIFYIQKASHSFSNTDGYALNMDFVNYIEVNASA